MLYYAVDISAVEWGARSPDFKSRRPDQKESHESEVFCLNPTYVDICRQLFFRQGDIRGMQLITLHFGTYQNRKINISVHIRYYVFELNIGGYIVKIFSCVLFTARTYTESS